MWFGNLAVMRTGMSLWALEVNPPTLTHPLRGSDTVAEVVKLASAMIPVPQVVTHCLDKADEVGMALCKGAVPCRGMRESPPPG